jgi:hypothetical protein
VTFDGVVYSLGKRAAVEYLARLGGVARRVEGKVEIDPVPEAWVDAGAVPPATLLALVPGSTDQGRFSLLADDQD